MDGSHLFVTNYFPDTLSGAAAGTIGEYTTDGATVNAALVTGLTGSYGLAIGPSAVPEPSTWALMLIGFSGLGYAAWRRTGRRPISVSV